MKTGTVETLAVEICLENQFFHAILASQLEQVARTNAD